jgi:hypothetical protein
MRTLAVLLLATIALPAALPAQPQPAASQQVSPRAVATTLADKLVSDFVFPEQGARYAQALRANAAAGAYDALSGLPLADRLTKDLQAVAPDGHLGVRHAGLGGGGPQIILKGPPPAAGSAAAPGQQPRMIRMAPPPAIEHAGWIAPGIAFVRFNGFPGDPETVDAARRFMEAHVDAKTIIFDIRTHRGGGLGEMDAIFPWLFDKPTRLVTMATRKAVDQAGGSPLEGVSTLRLVDGDPAFVTREHWVTPGPDRRLNDARVYVLTSGLSASAAEHFAQALKGARRATLIGSSTYGANHFGGDQELGGSYTAFIPVGRTFDPATGKDWEGSGVTPDIAVPAEDALVKALTLSGVAQSEASALSLKVAPMMPMATPRQASR